MYSNHVCVCEKHNIPWFDKDVIRLKNKNDKAYRSCKRKYISAKQAKYSKVRNVLIA